MQFWEYGGEVLIKRGGKTMQCPVCKGNMWDNRDRKKNPKAPDYRCKGEDCKFSFNPDTEEYEPGEFTTGVWVREPEKKDFKKPEKSAPTTPKINGKNPDEYVEGKKENTTLLCRTNLMCKVVDKWIDVLDTGKIVETFNALWNVVKA